VIGTGRGLVLVASGGQVIRHLPSPGVGTPVRWQDPRTVLIQCGMTPAGSASRLWLEPVSGARPAPVTPPLSSGQADYNIWHLASGSYLDALGRRCGNHVIARQEHHGAVQIYSIPGAGNTDIVAATSRRLLLQESPGCTSAFPVSLAWYNPATGAQTIAVPVSRHDAGVVDVTPYYNGRHRA